MGYGEAKKRLAELVIEYFQPYREKRAQLESDIGAVKQLLAQGAERAKAVARVTLAEARKAVGLGV
jgi:tryptophanyl-tRNA synthetase